MVSRHVPPRFWSVVRTAVIGDMGIPLLIVSLVLFVSAMVLLGANLSELRKSYTRMQSANEALVQIAMVNTDILRIEMIVRGYALVPDPLYRLWQDEAEGNEIARVAALTKTVAGDPVQEASARRLSALLAQHRAVFNGLMARLPAEKDGVGEDILQYGKQWKRGPIEMLLGDMRAEQTRHLAAAHIEAEARVLRAYRDAFAIAGLALLLGALGFALLLHGRRTARRAQALSSLQRAIPPGGVF